MLPADLVMDDVDAIVRLVPAAKVPAVKSTVPPLAMDSAALNVTVADELMVSLLVRLAGKPNVA